MPCKWRIVIVLYPAIKYNGVKISRKCKGDKKMGAFSKFMMFVLGAVAMVVAVVLLLLGGGVIGSETLKAVSGPQWSDAFIIAGAVVIVIGIVAFVLAFSKHGQAEIASASSSGAHMPSRNTQANGFVTIPANSGDIRVSFETIKSLAERASSKVEELKTTAISVGKKEDNLYLTLDVAAAPDTNIPAVAERLQKEVKDYIEGVISFGIEEIDVNVSGLNNAYRKKIGSYQN